MEMQQLRHFVAVVTHGNIVRAAEAVHITQPALSRSIQKLEDALGAKLLDREPRGVKPTVFGQSLFEHAQVILKEAERARTEIHAIKGINQGQVALGITPNFASFIAPDATARLCADFPNVNVSVLSAFYDDLIAALRQGTIDLAFSMLPPAYTEPEFDFFELFTNTSSVFVRADHPLAGKKNVSLETLSEQEWIVPDQVAVDRTFRTIFTGNNVSIPRQVVRTTSIIFLKEAMMAQGLVSIMPQHLVRAECEAGVVVPVDSPDCVVESQCGVITRKNTSRPPAVTALIDILKEECDHAAASASSSHGDRQ